jgi:hypothetical protein
MPCVCKFNTLWIICGGGGGGGGDDDDSEFVMLILSFRVHTVRSSLSS